MKKIKKNLFRFAIAGAFVFGGLLSFVPLNINAGELFNRIPCNSCSVAAPLYSYVDCVACEVVEGRKESGCAGKCNPSI
ncbi:MAG: hypothetical protein L3J54_06135 [Draconibacterium sp.]|nr:hypothetical protein [Draconibacterium sp.]